MDAIEPLGWRKLPFAPAVTSDRLGWIGLEAAPSMDRIGSYWHPVGTCARGLDTKAVVDPSLRVRGTTRLRTADTSIMPTITRKGATHA